jgi:hypothetical protein
MKKNILNVTLIVVFALSLLASSCGGNEKTDYEKAIDNLTGAKKGWVLSAATSSPAYALSNGSFATDLMKDGFLNECELDEIIKFEANSTQTINPGTNVCSDNFGYQEEKGGARWTLSEDTKTLNFQIPFFYNDNNTTFNDMVENAELLSCTEKEFRVKYTFDDGASLTKAIYSFTLTYTKK